MKTSLALLAAAALVCGCHMDEERGGTGSDYESSSGWNTNRVGPSSNQIQPGPNQGSDARDLSNTNSPSSTPNQ